MTMKFLLEKKSLIGIVILSLMLTGCIYWLRAFQVYQQMSDFDKNFAIVVTDEFTLQFNPKLSFTQTFISIKKVNSPRGRFRLYFWKLHRLNF